MKIKGMFSRLFSLLHLLRIKYVSYRTYIIITSVVIGIASALAAVLLKNIVHFIKLFLQNDLNFSHLNLLYFLYPIVGISLALIYVKLILKRDFTKGLSNLIYTLSKRNPEISSVHTYSHLITSALTVGFGGSVGLEAPIVSTGAAIGSNTAKKLRLNPLDKNLFIACGSAAGIAAIFNAPIAGIVFAFEVLLPEISVPSFIPLLISSATASIFSNFLYSDKLFFLVTHGWQFKAIPFYVLLGIFTGFISAYMVKVSFNMERYFKKSSAGLIKRLLIGGGILGILIFLFPPLYGEGYGVIGELFKGNSSILISSSIYKDFISSDWFIVAVGTAIIFIKIFATTITLGAGGNGGVFAPSLFTGALVGFVFTEVLRLTGLMELNQANFIAASMAGIMSGVLHAPLTAIFLIAEVTGGYALFVPLMIVSAISYFLARYLEPYSVYTKILAKEKGWVHHNKDMSVLEQISLTDLIETDFTLIYKNELVSQVIDKVYGSKRSIFPVVDVNQNWIGFIHMNDIKDYVFRIKPSEEAKIIDFVHPIEDVIKLNEDVSQVMAKFEKTDHWHLPVLDNCRYIGFVSKSKLLNQYRKLIQQERQLF